MSLALVAGAVAPTTLRVAQPRKQKAVSIAAGCPTAKRQRTARNPIAAAAGQKFVNWAVESPLSSDVIETAASISPVLVAFHVPACQLAFGEHLRVVGSCAQLGGWDPAAAPALEWTEGDNWTASVALPSGQHAFKLVLVRQHGSPYWELGPDRSLELPVVAAASSGSSTSRAVADAAAPLLSVTCSWGDTAAMTVSPDSIQLGAAAEAAAPQAAGPHVQQGQKEEGVASGMVLDMAQAHRDAILALVSHNIGALLAAEQQQLEAQQAQHAQQQHAVAEAVAAFADAAAAVHDAETTVRDAVDSWDAQGASEIAAAGPPAAADGPSALAAEPAAPAAVLPLATALPAKAPPHAAAAASSSEGEQLFHFGGGSEGLSALQMARQQLVGRLPREAAAGLEAALRSMNGAPGSRRQRAVLASLALHGPAVPAEQLYGVGSHERHPLAAHTDSPGQAAVAEGEAEEEVASLAAQLDQRLALAGAANHTGGASRAVPAAHKSVAEGKPDNPVLRGSFPGAAAYLAAQSVVTVGSLLWSAGRAAMPKAGRRVADAAVALACTAAAAVALS